MNTKGFPIGAIIGIILVIIIIGLIVSSGQDQDTTTGTDETGGDDGGEIEIIDVIDGGEIVDGVDLESCVTGSNAVPKSKFNWKWSQINAGFCDVGNDGAVFCDGAQFMVSFVERLESLEGRTVGVASNPFTNWEIFLKRVNFTSDWRNDFFQRYQNQDLTTSSFFKQDFSEKFSDDTKFLIETININTPGKYRVITENPTSDIEVITKIRFELIEAIEDDAFNWIPFEGDLGKTLESADFDRVGYGAEFFVDKKISFNSDYSLPGGLQSAKGRYPVNLTLEEDVKKLNFGGQRGNLLKISLEKTGGIFSNANIVFSPTLADPFLIKGTSIAQDASTIKFRYNVFEAENEITGTGSLIKWSPVGMCADFAGKNRSKTDSTGNSGADNFREVVFRRSNISQSQRITGDVYLQTVFYSPTGKHAFESHITAVGLLEGTSIQQSGLGFIDESISILTPTQSIPLNGVTNMLHNSIDDKIVYLEQVFELVEQKLVCVKTTQTDTELTQTFVWVEEKLFANIKSQINAIQETCVVVADPDAIQEIEDTLGEITTELNEIQDILEAETVQIDNSTQATQAIEDIDSDLGDISGEIDEIEGLLE